MSSVLKKGIAEYGNADHSLMVLTRFVEKSNEDRRCHPLVGQKVDGLYFKGTYSVVLIQLDRINLQRSSTGVNRQYHPEAVKGK